MPESGSISNVCSAYSELPGLRGFYFEKLKKAYEALYAGENSYVYGDAFKACEGEDGKSAIEQIGSER